jgi:hypothetical protein
MKPVAWMEYIQDEEWEIWFVEPTNLPNGHTYKPLYTAPRELSDDEIMELAEYHGINDWLYETSVTDFARAILKKASE